MSTLATTVSSLQPTGRLAALQALFARVLPTQRQRSRQALPEGAAELLARADAYEATQPSFAADLRAGAHRLLETR